MRKGRKDVIRTLRAEIKGGGMTDDVKVVEHIKLIQPIISRMSSSSFTVKGFMLTIQALLLGFTFNKEIWQINIVLFFMTILLALLDMFYLWQERLYRCLYDKIRLSDKTDFSMNTKEFKKIKRYMATIKSVAIWPFYSGLLVINIISLILEVLKCLN